jgi:hypothetical protein
VFPALKKIWKGWKARREHLTPEDRARLKRFFLNHPRSLAEGSHDLLAWAYHVHGMALDFYQDALDTPTFCEATQIRQWEKANLSALAAVMDEPLDFHRDIKEIRLDEIAALREDLQKADEALQATQPDHAILASHRYLTWSGLYFDHFPVRGIQQGPLLTVNMLAEHAGLVAHPYLNPAETLPYKRTIALAALKHLAWDIPAWHLEELGGLIKNTLAQVTRPRFTEQKVQEELKKSRSLALAWLKYPRPPELVKHSEARRITIQKIEELQAILHERPRITPVKRQILV